MRFLYLFILVNSALFGQQNTTKVPVNSQYGTKIITTESKKLDANGYFLNNRVIIKTTEFENSCLVKATVTVKIEVDRQGKVVNAKPGLVGTTSLNKCNLQLAVNMASSILFNKDENAPEIQMGSVRVVFKDDAIFLKGVNKM